MKGFVSMRDGVFEVRSDENRKEYPRGAVRQLRSEEAFKIESHPINKQKAPASPTVWGGSLDTALSMTRGNAETKTVNLGLRLARVSPGVSSRFYFTSIFSETKVNEETTRFSEIFRGGARFEINVSRRLLTFGFTDLERDRNQGLDSRIVGGGGLGFRLIKNKTSSMNIFAGGSANHEELSNGISRLSSEFVAGTDITQQLTKTTSITESLIAYPNLSSRGQYRVTFDSSIVTKLNSWLAWHVTTANRYSSNPAPGGKTNDLLLTTGIRFVRRGETLQNLEARPELRRR
jgi:putative salt-induced outer membrane protein YdiY